MSERTMLDLKIDDAVEPKVVPADEEYVLRIVSAGVTKSDKGVYLIPRFEVQGEPYSKEFTHPFRTDFENMSEKDANNAKFRLSQFFNCFRFNYRGGEFDPADQLPGLQGPAILGVKETDEYGEQNFVKKFVVPK
jgi:hypothetical protein